MDKITVIHSTFGRVPQPFPDLEKLSIDGDSSLPPSDADSDSDEQPVNSSALYIIHTSRMFEPEGWFLGREYHVVTRGITVGIFHELSEVRRSVGSLPTALVTTFKTWQQAIGFWDYAREGGDVTLLPEDARRRLNFPAPPPRLSPSFSPSPTPMQRTTRTTPAITRSATSSALIQGVAAAPGPPASPMYVSSAAPTPVRRVVSAQPAQAAAVAPGAPDSPIYVSELAPTPPRRVVTAAPRRVVAAAPRRVVAAAPPRRAVVAVPTCRVIAALPIRRAMLAAPVRRALPTVPTAPPVGHRGMPPFVRPPGWPTFTQRAQWTMPTLDDPFSHYWHTPGGTEGAANHSYHWATENATQTREPTGTPRRFVNAPQSRLQTRALSPQVLVPDTPPPSTLTLRDPISLFPTPKKQRAPAIVISDSDSEIEATEPVVIQKFYDHFDLTDDENGKGVLRQTYDAATNTYFTISGLLIPLENVATPAPVASDSDSRSLPMLAPVASGSGSHSVPALASVASGSTSQSLPLLSENTAPNQQPAPVLPQPPSTFISARAFEKTRAA